MKSLLSISYLIALKLSVAVLPSEVQGQNHFNLLPEECGYSEGYPDEEQNITFVFQYPWMVIIRYMEMTKIVDQCTGSLINERYILTAAHCIRSRRLHSVILGEHTKRQERDCNKYYHINGTIMELDCAKSVQEFGIESFEYHHDYNRPKYSNDIGLIRLNRSVIMKDHIRPICLPVTSELQSMAFSKYFVTGWGTTGDGTPSDTLLQAVKSQESNEACQEIFDRLGLNIRLSSKQICSGGGENKVDSCILDSGGPLGLVVDSQFVQFGISSVGTGYCGQNSVPGVYSRVASYMDWILDKMLTDSTNVVKVLYRKLKNKAQSTQGQIFVEESDEE